MKTDDKTYKYTRKKMVSCRSKLYAIVVTSVVIIWTAKAC